jgi:uncharacterized protein YndB with AHSA1/START domain
MVYTEVTIDIDAPPDRVWAVIADVERWPGWTESVHDLSLTSEGELAIGATARIDLAGATPSTWTVTELEPGRMFTWESKASGVLSVASHVLEPRDGGSRVTLWVKNSGWLATILTPYLAYVGRRNLKWESEGLKRRCESPEP